MDPSFSLAQLIPAGRASYITDLKPRERVERGQVVGADPATQAGPEAPQGCLGVSAGRGGKQGRQIYAKGLDGQHRG